MKPKHWVIAGVIICSVCYLSRELSYYSGYYNLFQSPREVSVARDVEPNGHRERDILGATSRPTSRPAGGNYPVVNEREER